MCEWYSPVKRLEPHLTFIVQPTPQYFCHILITMQIIWSYKRDAKLPEKVPCKHFWNWNKSPNQHEHRFPKSKVSPNVSEDNHLPRPSELSETKATCFDPRIKKAYHTSHAIKNKKSLDVYWKVFFVRCYVTSNYYDNTTHFIQTPPLLLAKSPAWFHR